MRHRVFQRYFRATASEYNALHARSIGEASREGFWKEQSERVVWHKPPQQVLDMSRPKFPRWFPDGLINASFNCLDRHVNEGRGEETALFYDSPVSGMKSSMTFKELLHEVELCAGMLVDKCNVKTGDTVVIYMPMIPEAVISMLACARIGAPHSVVFGGFASRELAVRINDANAKVVLSATCGIEPNRIVEYEPLLKGALDLCKVRPDKVVIKQRMSSIKSLPVFQKGFIPGAMDWDEEMKYASKKQAVFLPSTNPLYTLYTSGSTGTPKGIVRDIGGYVTSMAFSMSYFMGVKPGDVYFAASDVGWVVGHSYIVYGPLIAGCATVLYEGKPVGTPDAAAFWRLIEEYKVNQLFTAPTALRAIRKVDPKGDLLARHDLRSLKSFFLAGERADPETIKFYSHALTKRNERKEVPLLDCFWMTETGWPVCGMQDSVQKMLPGSTAKPLPGFNVCILKAQDEGEEGVVSNATPQAVPANDMGMICIKSPLPPGTLLTVFNNDTRYLKSYMDTFEGYFNCGDMGFQDQNGYITVMTRTDDLINVAGHRLSTGTLEQAIQGHPDVAEVACLGANDSLKGEVCVGFIVVHNTVKDIARVEKECIARVRELVGPVASFHNCYSVQALPKTRSGKTLRGVIRRILNGEKDWISKVPGTVEDVSVLYTIEKVIQDRWVSQ